MRAYGAVRDAILAAALVAAVHGCADDPTGPSGVGVIVIAVVPDTLAAPWSLSGPDGAASSGTAGDVLRVSATGDYTLTWGTVPGWITPVRSTQRLEAGDTLTFRGFYSEDPGIGEDFFPIAPGTFTMGSPADEPGRFENESPHETTLTTPFLIAAREVTNARYAVLAGWAIASGFCSVNDTGLLDALDGSAAELLDLDHPDSEISWDGSGLVVAPGRENHPVRAITWYGAAAYCDWLSLRDGLPRAYDHATWSCNGYRPYAAQGYRLPTEAEWEYACRAGTATGYFTGDPGSLECDEPMLEGIAWYCGNAGGTTHRVGQLAPNGWGLHDMHGNAYEWCNDRYGDYDGDETDPVGPADPSIHFRIFRGGDHAATAPYCRSAYRRSHVPDVVPGITIAMRPVRSTGMEFPAPAGPWPRRQ